MTGRRDGFTGEAPRRQETGFTLVEVIISVALAMLLTTMAMVAFFNIRRLVARAETRLTMHASAQTLYTAMFRSFNSLQQTCAFVVSSSANTAAAGATPNDQLTVVFMRGKEDTQDFQYNTNSYAGQGYKSLMNSDLLWEKWTWKASTNTLYRATNSVVRTFKGQSGFSFNGVSYVNATFDNVPQPRRVLDTTTLRSWQLTLNDNQLFPNATTGTDMFKQLDNLSDTWVYNRNSLASPYDLGDYQDLEFNMMPVLTQVTAFSIQVVPHDNLNPDTFTVDGVPGATPSVTHVLNGVWLDGRMASALATSPSYYTSDLAKRPRIIRIRFTLTSTVKPTFSQDFSFSYLIGMGPTP
jgi:type II secretory pathway pseudopilin PulG